MRLTGLRKTTVSQFRPEYWSNLFEALVPRDNLRRIHVMDGQWLDSRTVRYAELLLADWLRNPESVPTAWGKYFESFNGELLNAEADGSGGNHSKWCQSATPGSGTSLLENSSQRNPALPVEQPDDEFVPAENTRNGSVSDAVLQERVDQLIRNYRVRGHMIASLDPLGRERSCPPELTLEHYGLTQRDLDRLVSTRSMPGADRRSLRELLEHLRNTYCRFIGVQFMHIDDLAVREWLQVRMEETGNRVELPRRWQYRILSNLAEAVAFEEFIQKKYVGAKSFSLEGAETLIPLLDLAIEHASNGRAPFDATTGVSTEAVRVNEIVIGMAHRGRLNVLANVLGKNPRAIFREFEDSDPQKYFGSGDVKYHLGHSGDQTTTSGRDVHLSLCFNPSHLEFVNPVALGRARAKQDRFGDVERRECLTLLIHGDAAFSGEGVVQETLNLSELAGYRAGGTLHVIVNNQLGFTTTPDEGRSTTYCTDVARMLQSPVFHVNGEDPEAVASVVQLAMDFRLKFQQDVFIDLFCYRLRGHNEGDEPAFTQPQMYEAIRQRSSIAESYRDHLVKLGGVTREDLDQVVERHREWLEEELSAARSDDFEHQSTNRQGIWKDYSSGAWFDAEPVNTGVEAERLKGFLRSLTEYPDDFHPHDKIIRGLEQRRKMADDDAPLDWSAAEAMAFASLAAEGTRIRMSGQDSQRGTFSQRHAVLHDVERAETWMPLQHVADNQVSVEIHNSPLSEAGVLGFEYGYSLDSPDALVVWEAQFGDFVNAGQVIIDQFLASAEDKWNRLSGLVLLLPHGFEGQGPEHSSARLERFLMLCAENNIQVVQPTTPAQYFHVLRRQIVQAWRKPLIVLTPKSLLRHKQCVSNLDDLATGRFRCVLADESVEPYKVERILLCSGKLYFDLLKRRETEQRRDIALLRIEQFYPFATDELLDAVADFDARTPAVWIQEEPINQGAWWFLRSRLEQHLDDRYPLSVIAREESASPATGSKASHRAEQEQLLNMAFGDEG